MYDKKSDDLIRSGIDNWTVNHATCGIDGCKEKTDIAIAVVDKAGKRLHGRFSEFGRWRTANGEVVDLTLYPQYKWIRWITRCTHHYTQERNNYLKHTRIA